MDPARRRTLIIAEVVAIAVAVAAGAFLGVRARNSDDTQELATPAVITVPATTSAPMGEPATATTPSTAAPTTTTTPPTTTAPTTTTSPPTTTAPTTTATPPTTTAPTTTTSPPTTTAPTTTTAAPPNDSEMEAALLAALPQPADLPEGWSVDPEETTGAGFWPSTTGGYCGGPDADQRAVDAGASATATFFAEQPNGGWYDVRLVGFPTADAAHAYIQSTRDQIDSCDGTHGYTLPEGDGSDGTFDGFFGSDPAATWRIAAGTVFEEHEFTGVDEAVRIYGITSYKADLDGVQYGWTETRILQHERLGRIVVTHRVLGDHSLVGWSDEPGYDYEPTQEDLVQATIVFTEPLFRGLLDQGLISIPT